MVASRRKFIKNIGALSALPLLPLPGTATYERQGVNMHRVLTCNIRVALPEDEAKGMGWPQRKAICLKIIGRYKPDIVCFQEVLKVQAEDIRNYFPGHGLVGFDGPEMDAHTTGYHGIAKNPILFSKKRYELLNAGTYWLSETPLVAGSKSWDTARARHANWVRLRENKTGKEFRVISLHLDHVSAEAKIQQAKMVVEESAQYPADFPQIMAGDFNTRFNSRVLTAARQQGWLESYETIHGPGEAGFTVHAFQGKEYKEGSSKGKIDFVWYKGKLKPSHAAIIKDSVNDLYPSDHFFVLADFNI